MSKEIKYHVLGKFEGSFKTFQNLNLAFGDTFPEDGKHLIRIYRGVISNSKTINAIEFDDVEGEISLSDVSNIQINKSDNWPEINDRIFHLPNLKLRKVSITGLQTINKQTYGNIHAEICASVSENLSNDFNSVYNENIIDTQVPKSDSDFNNDDKGEGSIRKTNHKQDKQKEENSFENNHVSDEHKIPKKKWNLNLDPSVLKWIKRLFWILFIILLILLFTKWGEQLICSIQKYAYQTERIGLVKDRLKLESVIERTRPKKSKCGSQVKFDGDSTPQEFIYTLGTISGDVIINYDMYNVPDRIEVSYNGKAVAETNDRYLHTTHQKYNNKGFADSSGTLIFRYNYKANELHELTIRVIPNPKYKNTKWEFNVKCPQ